MRILFVVHGYPPSSRGGTELYAHALARALRARGDEVTVLARQADPRAAEYSTIREAVDGVMVVRVNNTFLHASSFDDTYRNATIDAVSGRVIADVRPDVVHVHHLTCLSTGIVGQCAARGVPVVLTLQDYWLLCHRGQLLDLDLARCEGPAPDRCATCAGLSASPRTRVHRLARLSRALERRLPPQLASLQRRLISRTARRTVPAGASLATARRLEEARAVWDAAACLLAPSQTLFDRFARAGAPASKMRLQDQGIDLTPFKSLARDPGDRLRVGFVGSLMASKAPHLVLEAAAGMPPESVSVTIAGDLAAYHGDDSYSRTMRPLLERPGVRWIGPVDHEAVPALLSSLDVVVVPSVWIENAPFVIREAWAAGAVVVASRLGGMAEMVSDGRDGLLFEPGNSADLRGTLARLLDEPGLLERLRGGIPVPRSIEDDAAWTSALYEEVRAHGATSRVRHDADHEVQNARCDPTLAGVVLNYRTPDDTLLAVRSLEASRRGVSPVIVVDNGGDSACERALAAGGARVQVIRTVQNLGFSGGCNVGIRRALDQGADLVLLLNSDAVLAPDAVGLLEEALAAGPTVGIAAPLVVSRAEPGVVASAGIRYSTATGRMRHLGVGSRADEMSRERPTRVTAASGCAMLVRREVFEAAGLFDERYFFSFEDIEFCGRAARAGWGTWLVPAALAYHESHRTVGPRSPARLYFASRNHLLLARTLSPASGPASFLRAGAIVLLNAAYAVRSPNLRTVSGLVAVARGTLDHLRGRYGSGPREGR